MSIPETHKAVDNGKRSRFSRLRESLSKTRNLLGNGMRGLFGSGRKVDAAMIEELEDLLLSADLGIEATDTVLENIHREISRGQADDAEAVYRAVKQRMQDILAPCAEPLRIAGHEGPFVIMVVGVNGVGKTTTIGKLARRFQEQGLTVMLGAADTFRAAATEQLMTWGERNNVPVVAQQQGADAASVAHDAMQSALARGVDVLIVDTAGRQHTHHNLMQELKKIKRVIGARNPGAPHEVLMVLDAGTGQNALSQLEHFDEAVDVTGLVLTKLDGTAKGGILLAIASRAGLPIRFIGVGEGIDDLREFDAADFTDALLG
jgi:fused signal recognition particle receptor